METIVVSAIITRSFLHNHYFIKRYNFIVVVFVVGLKTKSGYKPYSK